MKWSSVFLPVFLMLAISTMTGTGIISASAQERVKVQTIEEFDRDGKPVPLSKGTSDLLAYISQALHIQFQVQRVPWKRAMENALHDDVILLGMSINKERSTKYLFSDTINANGNWLVTRCDTNFPFNSLQDLKGKLIGVVAGTSSGEAFDAEVNKLFRVENDIGAGISRLQKLMAKRMDALVWYDSVDTPKALEHAINLSYTKRGLHNSGNAKVFCVQEKPISIVSNHFAMRISPANRQLLDRINLAMAKGRKEGSIPPVATTILH
ncbi:substrate-binding periplasmic protein [Undibacterium danionis]|uniref:Substrate-binding periplasmic protein n=1 Tax=Undibacterium danionis TaxID=1812100 RepID=A0ABV6II62_9BURK